MCWIMVILQSRSRYTAKSLFLSLHGHDFIIMPNDAVDGYFQGKSLTALTAFWYTQQCW